MVNFLSWDTRLQVLKSSYERKETIFQGNRLYLDFTPKVQQERKGSVSNQKIPPGKNATLWLLMSMKMPTKQYKYICTYPSDLKDKLQKMNPWEKITANGSGEGKKKEGKE